LPRNKDLDLKHLSLPKKVPKEFKDIDSKYQSLPKKKPKDVEGKYQSLPKRNFCENEGRHLSTSRKSKDHDRHNSSKRSSSREYEVRNNKRENRSQSNHGKSSGKRSSDPPRSPRWIQSDSDEDDLYSSIKSRDDSSHQSSIPEIPYSRPLPPLPAPSRYRRRTTEKDDQSPPVPPPRVSTLTSVTGGPPADPSLDSSRGICPVEAMPPPLDKSANLLANTDHSKDSGYHPPPPRIPHSKLSSTRMSELLVDKIRASPANNPTMTVRESPQGGAYPPNYSADLMPSFSQRKTTFSELNNAASGFSLTLPYPGAHGSSRIHRGYGPRNLLEHSAPYDGTYPRNMSKMSQPSLSNVHQSQQYCVQNNKDNPGANLSSMSGSYKLRYLDMVQQFPQNRTIHSGLPSSAIPLPGLSA
jgi:hypothetical protein